MDNFLQSEEWKKFQEAVGWQTISIEGAGFRGNGVVHNLPVVGKYLYFPRGPVSSLVPRSETRGKMFEELLALGKKGNAKWVRIEPRTEEELALYKEAVTVRQAHGDNLAIIKAPHDVQPRETLVMDISPDEETLLQKMKSKTRYNIRLAEKKGVKVFPTREKKYEEAFLELMKSTATRKEITSHPRSHYAHFFSALPQEFLFLFVAEYQDRVLAANVLVLFGDTATYLHGGSSDVHRDAMAPYLLQWEQIRFAKSRGMKYYDFGGIMTQPTIYPVKSSSAGPHHAEFHRAGHLPPTTSSWSGITRFKTGFAPDTAPTVFPGSYDIVLDTWTYFLYNQLSRLRGLGVKLRRESL